MPAAVWRESLQTRGALASTPCQWPASLLVVGLNRGLDALGTNFGFKLLPYRSHGITPLLALLRGQVEDFGFTGSQNGLLVTLVELVGMTVHIIGYLNHDLRQLGAHIFRQAVPELGIGNYHVVEQAVVGFGDVLLYFVHFLRVDVGVGVFRSVNHAGLQALIHLGKGHFARYCAHCLELLFQYGGGLYAEFQAAGIPWLQQFFVGRQLFQTIVPVAQPRDSLVLHGGEQLLADRAFLEAINGFNIIKQEWQIENLDGLGIVLKLGQRWRDDLYIVHQQGFHFLAITK